MKKRLTRLGVFGLAVIAVSAVTASPATAKTKTAFFNQCVSTFLPIVDPIPTPTTGSFPQPVSAIIPVTVPKNPKGQRQDGLVTAVTGVTTRITHTFDSDLEIWLRPPSGKAILLANRVGGSGDGYGSGAASCAGALVSFGDAFTASINVPGNVGNAPIIGAFRPVNPLSSLNGSPAAGNWSLTVTDFAAADTGSLNAFGLQFTYTYNAKNKKKKKKKK